MENEDPYGSEVSETNNIENTSIKKNIPCTHNDKHFRIL